jgi:hypothetical protein
MPIANLPGELQMYGHLAGLREGGHVNTVNVTAPSGQSLCYVASSAHEHPRDAQSIHTPSSASP